MRKALLVFFCFISVIASATDYYVSSSGNDSSDGRSSSTPWQTISKVNSIFSSLGPGDRILFRRGDVFYGTLRLYNSGGSGNPITLSAYGTGSEPVITGFTTMSGWNSYGDGIYYRSLSCESDPNMVTMNGEVAPIGRWPNSGYMTIDSHSSNYSIYDSDLSGWPDWTGGEIVIRKNLYIWDRNRITDHSGGTIDYESGSDYAPENGNGYFIQNSIETLDSRGEWYYNGENFFMYFGSSGPSAYTVKVSSANQLLYLDNANYITIENISFEGANQYAIQIRNSDYVTVRSCRINYTGDIAIYGPWHLTSPHCTISGNTISNSNSNAIYLSGDHTYATVSGNMITNSGTIIGMGGNGDATYLGMNVFGANSTIQYNEIQNSGYAAINFAGNNTNVRYNFVNYFNLVKNDGGGIYTYVGNGTPYQGMRIEKNIVLNGIGYSQALPDGAGQSICGIYLDDQSEDVAVIGNTVAYCNSGGLYLHNSHEIEVRDNTLFNNGSGRIDYGSQLLIVHDGISPNDPIRNITMTGNILFSKTSTQLTMAFSTRDSDIPEFGYADYNYYARPLNDNLSIRTWSSGWYSSAVNRSLSGWQSFTGQDGNSSTSPISLTDESKIRFEYNPTSSDQEISLDAGYIDINGTKYSGSVTLEPYSSIILMVDPNPSAAPAVPVYVSSSVESSSPSVVELNYNLSLANIVPSASAFSVQVNSTARSISSVSVSGTKVRLTLSSAVASGNTVTVAYTAPSSNPLQTPAGGKAASFSARTVTNNVVPPAVPVITGAIIENAYPTVVVLTYNLTLASITPASSAFTVTVNSTNRTISSVYVTGTQVKLTLSSAVAYGNTVTVAYTKPSSNPVQTPAGGQAASFSARSVTNQVNATSTPPSVVTPPAATNTPPVVTINYSKEISSGFVGTFNASGSYDANKDNLTYTWKLPSNIPVSSTSGPVVQFLAPVVDTKQTYNITLVVSDGKSPQTKSFPLEVLPYQPQLETAEIVAIETDEVSSATQAYNIIDGNIGTTWSVLGRDKWIILELKNPFSIQHVKLAFQPNIKKEFYFDIYGSDDKETWEPILSKSASCAFSGNLQVFDFPESKAEREFKYVKVVGQGNASDQWNYIAELRIFGYRHRNPEYENQIVKIYPNPASELVNIRIDEPSFIPDFINILTLSGKIIYTNIIEPDIRLFQVPLNLKRGIYLIQMGKGSMTMFSQKLVVAN